MSKFAGLDRALAMYSTMELSVHQDHQTVTSDLPEPDPEWRFVDAAGHGHFRSDDGYPTLEWVTLPCTMGHDDCDAEGSYRCLLCDEEIRPATRRVSPVTIPGIKTFTLKIHDANGGHSTYVFDEEQWQKAEAAATAAIKETLKDCITEHVSYR